MTDDGDCGAFGCRGNRRTRETASPVPLSPTQIPHDLTQARTRAAAVGSLSYGMALHGGQVTTSAGVLNMQPSSVLVWDGITIHHIRRANPVTGREIPAYGIKSSKLTCYC
jgi:hypothetical protein